MSSSISRDVGRGVVSSDAAGEGGALRIGLVADTHIPQAAAELWPQVFAAFADCDAILHGGDIYEQRLLDLLGDVAPTFAARGNGEERLGGWALDDSRVHDTWILDAGGVRIGIIHDLTIPEVPPGLTIANVSRRRFGIDADIDGKLDVIIYGDTHVQRIDVVDSTLCVNPGSPTYPRNLEAQLGTIGFLTISTDVVVATLCQLTAVGFEVTQSCEVYRNGQFDGGVRSSP
jgi:putative phosphoesterase